MENGVFVRVDGARRVRDVMVQDGEKGKWLPLDPARIYRVAGCDYTLLRQGDGHRFPDVKVVVTTICPYVEALERYLRNHLGGVIDKNHYGHPQGRIYVR